jgi:hypothetical protein
MRVLVTYAGASRAVLQKILIGEKSPRRKDSLALKSWFPNIPV